jgi:hypothetical protein
MGRQVHDAKEHDNQGPEAGNQVKRDDAQVLKKNGDANQDDDGSPSESPANIAEKHDLGAGYLWVALLVNVAVYSLMYLLFELVLKLFPVVLFAHH